jgi:hypothetical protein|tara:strand:+ start:180 stop:362 length:183 start_codon:yes stop_codon:yes gene_type:complete
MYKKVYFLKEVLLSLTAFENVNGLIIISSHFLPKKAKKKRVNGHTLKTSPFLSGLTQNSK